MSAGVRLSRLDREERGQVLPIVLALITLFFMLGSALAVHASTALRTAAVSEQQAGEMHGADAGAELGIWWQRNGRAGNPPNLTVNGATVTTTVSVAAGVVTITSTAGGSTVTATYPDSGAAAPTLSTWTTTR